ncbi:hypothetical protein OTK49_00485 [Vibrio coralliirubri]|uniref:hypothetical protein n=1 Tax=Vibrio coralliirubri TaxID=1516159 RepID=UPI00228379E5|nr:hypothetical protein [Vibrio coralliirubri]MCY9861018.1 hypothetical protein [Vibrio coralliirubri]
MKNFIKLAMIAAIPFGANASTENEPRAFSMGVYQTDLKFDWSIDNSHTAGHPEKASEIIWKTKAIGLELNYDTKWTNRKLYFAMSDEGSGSMTDEDWRYTGGNLEKWSSTRSDADFLQIGYRDYSVNTRWHDSLWMDTIDFNIIMGFSYEQFKAFGLINNFTDDEMRDDSVRVMSNKAFTLHSGIGFDFEKTVNNWTFGFEQNFVLDNKLNLDYHHLRTDLKDVSFVILSPYLGVESKLYTTYKFDNDFTLSAGASYGYSFALIEKVFVRQENAEEGATDVNSSTREEVKAFITLSKKFG